MKKIVLLSIVSLLFFLPATLVVGCQQQPAPASPLPTPAPIPTPTPTPTPASGISWEDAKDHIGERTTVCGPVVGTHWASGSKGKPTFLNIGRDYPDPGRFTVVIWGENRANFPQPPEGYYLGKTICVTGLIEPYEGTPQIEAKHPDQIEEQ